MININYNKVNANIVKQLESIVGEGNLVYNDKEKLRPYSHDEVSGDEYAHMPEVVVKPSSAEEISSILKLANAEKIPVTPRGGGTGLSGGAVPVYGGILISVENMNNILEFDQENHIIVVEPGVVTNDINKMVEKEGLFFAGYPMSLQSCFIGGNVAENAGGGRAIKYGVTGRYVLGVEAVLPTGEIVTFGGKRVKDVTGYNMLQLLVGCEGTLAIFTKIFIKLLPLPPYKIDLLALFESVNTAISVVPKIMSKSRIIPTGIEFMDRLSITSTYKFLGEKMPYPETGAVLLIELDGTRQEHLREDAMAVSEVLTEQGAIEIYAAETPDSQEKMWRVRRSVPEAFKSINPVQSVEDIVVPISKIPDIISYLEELSQNFGVIIPCFGHAGDGNLHATIIKSLEDSMEQWQQKLPSVLKDLYSKVHSLGGTISGEHGIGHKRKKFLNTVLGQGEINVMKAVKKALDPENILNPGKIFEEDF